jgi:hypothetical protein
VLLTHWVKIEMQPKRHTKSWNITIDEQQNQISSLLATAPSLSRYGAEAIALALPRAPRQIERRWTVEEILSYQPPDPPHLTESISPDD